MIQKHMVECPVCGEETKYKYSVDFVGVVGISDEYEFQIHVCKNCNHVFVSNPIDEGLLADYYKRLSKYEVFGEKINVPISKLKMANRQFDFIEGLNIEYNNILEIGSSMGTLLNEFKNHGYDVYGVEPSANNCKYAEMKYDIQMFQGTFEEYMKKSGVERFDLILLSHVLEHINDPLSFIDGVRNINNRYLLIEVPTMNVPLVGEPFGIFFFEHINYFGVQSLSYLMNQMGYKPLKINVEYNVNGESPSYPTMVTLWEKGAGNIFLDSFPVEEVLDIYIRQNESIFETISKKIDSIKSDKLAVWGTGSHTSKLLGMTNLSDKNIVKYYDSDRKKHEFSILDKPITAFDIQDVRNGLVDTILVSSFASEMTIKKVIEEVLSEELGDIEIITLYN